MNNLFPLQKTLHNVLQSHTTSQHIINFSLLDNIPTSAAWLSSFLLNYRSQLTHTTRPPTDRYENLHYLDKLFTQTAVYVFTHIAYHCQSDTNIVTPIANQYLQPPAFRPLEFIAAHPNRLGRLMHEYGGLGQAMLHEAELFTAIKETARHEISTAVACVFHSSLQHTLPENTPLINKDIFAAKHVTIDLIV